MCVAIFVCAIAQRSIYQQHTTDFSEAAATGKSQRQSACSTSPKHSCCVLFAVFAAVCTRRAFLLINKSQGVVVAGWTINTVAVQHSYRWHLMCVVGGPIFELNPGKGCRPPLFEQSLKFIAHGCIIVRLRQLELICLHFPMVATGINKEGVSLSCGQRPFQV